MKDATVIIIPAYEPDEKLLGVIEDIRELTDFDIVVVNDGSSEDKAEIFEKARKNAVVLQHKKNKGKGAAVKTALGYIKENYSKIQ